MLRAMWTPFPFDDTEPTDDDLERYRRAQRLAYDGTLEVAGQLRAGMSERQAVELMGWAFERRGVREFFHQPTAWFGERAAFTGFKTPIDFLPTDKKLEPGMTGILDVAPIVDGVPADIGYAFALGGSAALDRARADLLLMRELILKAVLAERGPGAIYEELEVCLRDLGYQNRHRKYPFGVLAHRVPRAPRLPGLNRLAVVGFGVGSGLGLLAREAGSKIERRTERSPFWNRGASCDRPPGAGLWAVEPHIGRDGLGAKWEEMLAITRSTAFWIDDDPPHVSAARSAPGG
jgi:Xaa-Pro aminopeptidase